MPDFVDAGSKQIFGPPYQASGVRLYAFVLPADMNAMQSLCDRMFKTPSEGKVHCKPLLPFAMLTFVDIQRLNSSQPPDLNVGWGPERDVAFWMPSLRWHDDWIIPIIDRLDFAIPYIFVNQPMPTLTGRMVQSFPKEYAAIEMSRDHGEASPMSVTTHVFPTFSPQQEVQLLKILEVARSPQAADDGPAGEWARVEDALDAIWSRVEAFGEVFAHAGVKVLRDLGIDLLGKPLFNLFLKQMPDVFDASRACYQAITEVPFRGANFRRGGFLPGRYDVTIQDFASHPILADFGLQPAQLRNRTGVWLDFDFILDRGKVVWDSARA